MTIKEIKEVHKLLALFPREISVTIEKYEDGFLANIKTFEDCFTEASSFSELIEMVNDAVRTHLEIPEKYLSLMPTYRPLISAATKLGVYPASDRKSELKLEIYDGAGTSH